MTSPAHRTEVVHQLALFGGREIYQARCDCGWSGRQRITAERAADDAKRHVRPLKGVPA